MNKKIEYGVGKAGTVQMTNYLAMHWGRNNVRCNCVLPARCRICRCNRSAYSSLHCSRKAPRSDGLANPKRSPAPWLFFLSEAASYITGLNLFVDGVVTAALQFFHTSTNSISQFNIDR